MFRLYYRPWDPVTKRPTEHPPVLQPRGGQTDSSWSVLLQWEGQGAGAGCTAVATSQTQKAREILQRKDPHWDLTECQCQAGWGRGQERNCSFPNGDPR